MKTIAHRRNKPLPSREFLKDILNYDQITGVFTWKKVFFSNLIGTAAGHRRPHGYHFIGIKGFGQIQSHRLAWCYVHGNYGGESLSVDHRDGDRGNNAIANLRLATPSQQAQNARGVPNKSGMKGAQYFDGSGTRKVWRAIITINGKRVYLGSFTTAKEAHDAYALAAQKHFGEFARIA